MSQQSDTDTDTGPIEEDAITVKRTARVRFREACVGWTTVIANILVPVTIGFAGYSLLQDSWQEKSNAAQRQIELFYSGNMGEAQRILFALWDDVDLTVLRSPQSRSFIDAFVERAVAASDLDQGEVASAIVNLASYFDRVETCVASGQCDEDEILNQLGQYGRDFHCIYAGQIDALRQGSLILKLGEGLESFSGRMGGCGGKTTTGG